MRRDITPKPDRHFAVWPKGVAHHIEVPERSVAENLVETAARKPDAPATIFYGRALTFAELKREVDRLAGWLRLEADIAKGDRVLLYMQNSPQFIIGYYAILRADAVVVPVNPMNRTAELRHLVEDTGARVALVGQELLPSLGPLLGPSRLSHVVAAAYADLADPDFDIPLPPPLDRPSPASHDLPGVVRWADALAAGHRPGPITAGPDDLAVIPYSSGTTGRPKGCMHTHRTVMTTLVGGLAWNPQGLGDATLVALPLFHVTGMQNSMNGPIHYGESMVIMVRWDRRVAAELIRRYRISRWRSIATMAIDLVNDPELTTYDLSSLRMIGGGGAAMPEPVARRFKELTGLDYIEGYGLSETMAATHINPVDNPRRQCLGIPVFDVDARVIDPDTRCQLGPGEPGEIVIHAPQNFVGYWNNPEATRDAFIEIDGKPFLRTGDIGRFDAQGYFYMVDRVKRMINASGLKVWPSEVESVMHDHPQVAEVCVVGEPDARRGESVVAFVVAAAGLAEAELIAWCRENMAAYKCPRRVVFLDALPRSPSGKVQWRELQKRAQTT
jgi:fatty-acyl-CoA synthase